MAIAYDLPGFIRYRNEPSTMVIPVEQYPAAAIGHSLYVAIWMVGVSQHRMTGNFLAQELTIRSVLIAVAESSAHRLF
jgi:hypothetical protein